MDAKTISYLTQETQQLEAAVIDLELRRTRKTAQTIGEIVEKIKEILRHFQRSKGTDL